MRKTHMKEFRKLARNLIPLYTTGFESERASGSDIIKSAPKTKDQKGNSIKPDQVYNVRKTVPKRVDYVEEFKKAYKKGGVPQVQALYNYFYLVCEQAKNEQRRKEAEAELQTATE